MAVLVGELAPAELSEISAPLASTAAWTHFASAAAAMEELGEASQPPDVVILVQSRPGIIRDSEVIELQRAVPLAGKYAVLGSWCEGESRSGKPWPGVTRCYWNDWPSRWREEIERIRCGQLPLWSMPVTATNEERLLSRSHSRSRRLNSGYIVVVAASAEARRAVSEAARLTQTSVVECHPDQKIVAHTVQAIIWDTTLEAASDPEQVKSLKGRFRGAPLLALVTFPRRHNLEQMRAAGIAAVIAKPWLIEDLLQQIGRFHHHC